MTLQDIFLTIGIPAILGAFIYIGKKLHTLDAVDRTVDDIYDRFIRIEDRVDTLWKDRYAPAQSPRQLNEIGEKILNESGIKNIIESKKDKLLEVVRKSNPTNAYDAERAVFDAVIELPKHCPEVIDELKNGAFKVGQSLDAVLFVGGLHLRNIIFNDLGFSLEEIDKHRKNIK